MLGKTWKELEMMKGETSQKKKNIENNPEGKRGNQHRRIRSKRVNWRRQQNRQHGWPILQTLRKSLGWENLRERWCYDLAKWLSHYLYFSFSFELTTQERSAGKCHSHSHMISMGK